MPTAGRRRRGLANGSGSRDASAGAPFSRPGDARLGVRRGADGDVSSARAELAGWEAAPTRGRGARGTRARGRRERAPRRRGRGRGGWPGGANPARSPRGARGRGGRRRGRPAGVRGGANLPPGRAAPTATQANRSFLRHALQRRRGRKSFRRVDAGPRDRHDPHEPEEARDAPHAHHRPFARRADPASARDRRPQPWRRDAPSAGARAPPRGPAPRSEPRGSRAAPGPLRRRACGDDGGGPRPNVSRFCRGDSRRGRSWYREACCTLPMSWFDPQPPRRSSRRGGSVSSPGFRGRPVAGSVSPRPSLRCACRRGVARYCTDGGVATRFVRRYMNSSPSK